MSDTLSWLLVMEVLGVVGFALTFPLLTSLEDRGYCVSKVVGLLVVAYSAWILTTVGPLANDRPTLVLVAAIWLGAAVSVATARRGDLMPWIRARWRLLAVIEGTFLVVFLVALYLRSFVPEINQGEQPFELAFLTTSMRSADLPPANPWFAGEPLNYYYYGYYLIAVIAQIAGSAPGIAFNLGLVLVTALAAMVIFGLLANLTMPSVRLARAVGYGSLAVVLMLVLGNLEGVVELVAIHVPSSGGLLAALDIDGLDGPRESSRWYPTEWWFFSRATHLTSAFDYREFPFYALSVGSLHPHVLAMPVVLSAAVMGLHQLRSATIGRGRATGGILLGALIVGSLGAAHTWDLPPALALVGATIALAPLATRPPGRRVLVASFGRAVAFAVAALILFLPFYLDYAAPVSEVLPVRAVADGWPPLEAQRTGFVDLILLWGPLLLLAGTLLLAPVSATRWRRRPSPTIALALVAALAPAAVWIAWLAVADGTAAAWDEIRGRGSGIATLALLPLLVGFGIARFVRVFADHRSPNLAFGLIVAVLGVLLIAGPELFYVHDSLRLRVNTVFKLGFHAWSLLSIAAAFAVFRVLEADRHDEGASLPLPARRAWMAIAGTVVAAALAFPLIVTFHRTDNFQRDRGLDATAAARARDPAEAAAIDWLSQSAPGTILVEGAEPGGYNEGGRIAAASGVPTLVAWPGHQLIWRGDIPAIVERLTSVQAVYVGGERSELRRILGAFHVRYIVVGAYERRLYGEDVATRFSTEFPVVFERPGITIF